MRIRNFILLLIFSVSTALTFAAENESAESKILLLLEKQLVAANAHNANRFLAPFVHNNDVILISDGEILRGWNRIFDQQLKWWNNGKSEVEYIQTAKPEFTPLDAHSALVTQQMQARIHTSGGNAKSMTFVITTIWRESSAEWQIIYCHESFAH